MIVVIVDESSDSLDSFGNPPSDLDQGTPCSGLCTGMHCALNATIRDECPVL